MVKTYFKPTFPPTSEASHSLLPGSKSQNIKLKEECASYSPTQPNPAASLLCRYQQILLGKLKTLFSHFLKAGSTWVVSNIDLYIAPQFYMQKEKKDGIFSLKKKS